MLTKYSMFLLAKEESQGLEVFQWILGFIDSDQDVMEKSSM